MAGVYEKTSDRESAYEKLKGRAEASGDAAQADRRRTAGTARQPAAAADGGMMGELKDLLFGSTGPRGGKREGLVEKAALVGGAQHGLGGGPRDRPRRARRAAGRQQTALSPAGGGFGRTIGRFQQPRGPPCRF